MKILTPILDEYLNDWVIHTIGMIDKYNYLVVAQWADEKVPYKTKSGKTGFSTSLMIIDLNNSHVRRKIIVHRIGKVYCDGGIIKGHKEAFFSSYAGITFHMDKDDFLHEEQLSTDERREKGISRGSRGIRLIGDYFYSVDSGNDLHRRDKAKEWTYLSKDPRTYCEKIGDCGGQALASYSENEIYMSGRKGSLWHYDGKAWEKIPGIPKDMNLRYLECAEDGKVYAVDKHADGVAVGRGKDFKFIHMKDNDPVKGHIVYDACTFNGKMYIADGDIYEFKNGAWIDANIPGIYGSVEHLASKDGVMFIATPYSLKIYNGKETFTLYGEAKEDAILVTKALLEVSGELLEKGHDFLDELAGQKKN